MPVGFSVLMIKLYDEDLDLHPRVQREGANLFYGMKRRFFNESISLRNIVYKRRIRVEFLLTMEIFSSMME